MFRKTYAEIDGNILKENVKTVREAYPEYKYCIAVVKGNAYGHGMQSVIPIIEGGADIIATATLEEALKVRIYDKNIPILCLEPISYKFLNVAGENNITLTVCSEKSLCDVLENRDYKFKIHLKLDTGMNRLGFKSTEDVKNAVSKIRERENLTLEGIYTHLATSGLSDAWYDRQIENFKILTYDIDLKNIPIVHIDRSLTLVHHKKCDFVNGMRLGIGMYGFAQSVPTPTGLGALKRKLRLRKQKISQPIFENSLNLKTALKFYSEVIDIKKVKAGEFVGYGASFTTQNDMTVATVAAGYYDGVSKNLKYLYCGGKKCAIIGEMCMDMALIEVDDNVKIGDTVEIFGNNITVKQASLTSGISAYKLLTGITLRVPRIMNGKEYEL